jgi:tight adherence protein B
MGVLIFVLTFLTVTLLLLAVWILASSDGSQEVVRRRMEAVRKAERRGEVSLELKLVRDELLSSVPLLNRLMMQWSWSSRLQEYISQAGLKVKAGKIVLLSAVLGLGAYVIASRMFLQAWVPFVCGFALTVVPFAVLAWKRRRRMNQFEEHFPEALDLLGRAVRAGHAFTTGLEMIARESAEPIAGEFRATFEEQNFGLPVRDALLNLTERIPIVDVRFFVTALLVQKETGGNLAEILDGLSRVVRDRFRIYREVRTRTAQGRLTAAVLIGLPIFMLFALTLLNPTYMRILFDDPQGPAILATAALMQVIGAALIWKIIKIEV